MTPPVSHLMHCWGQRLHAAKLSNSKIVNLISPCQQVRPPHKRVPFIWRPQLPRFTNVLWQIILEVVKTKLSLRVKVPVHGSHTLCSWYCWPEPPCMLNSPIIRQLSCNSTARCVQGMVQAQCQTLHAWNIHLICEHTIYLKPMQNGSRGPKARLGHAPPPVHILHHSLHVVK